jgi:hypothetical protein
MLQVVDRSISRLTGEGRHDDGEVGFDRVAFVVVDRPGP